MSANYALHKLLRRKGLLSGNDNGESTAYKTLPELEQQGLIKETDALEALSEEFEIPFADFGESIFDVNDPCWAQMGEAFYWTNRLCPLAEYEDEITVATSNPLDLDPINTMSFIVNKKITSL